MQKPSESQRSIVSLHDGLVRAMFWPYREVSIYFEAFTLDVSAASGRFENEVEDRGRLSRE
jgi:hypothetical protein